MKKLTMICAILGLSFGMIACGDDDTGNTSEKKGQIGDACEKADDCESGVCTEKKCAEAKTDGNKKADGEKCDKNDECKSDICLNKVCTAEKDVADCSKRNEGDACSVDGTKICSAKKECVDAAAGCTDDSDCSGEYKTCDKEAKKCYKVNADYKIQCENKDGKVTAYEEERIYADETSKAVPTECKDDKPLCKEGIGCVPDKSEVECTASLPCKDKTKVCSADNKCIDDPHPELECHDLKPCAKEKTCVQNKCISVPKEGSECVAETTTAVCADAVTVALCDAETKKIIYSRCDPGIQCMTSDTAADCAEECKNKNEGDLDASICMDNAVWNYICTKAEDGKLYSIPERTECGDKKCKNGDVSKTTALVCK